MGTSGRLSSGNDDPSLGLPDKTYAVGLGGVTVYTVLPQATDPAYRASDTAHLSSDFTLDDTHGHQQTVAVGGTLTAAWTGPNRFTTAFAFDGSNPSEFDRTIAVGGINYSLSVRYGTPPGSATQAGPPAWGLTGRRRLTRVNAAGGVGCGID